MVEEVELSIGDIAPGFECTITNGEKINLSEIISQGEGVILYFYPRDNTPGCTIEACDFRDNFSRFKETGWKVIGVSTDSATSHEKFTNKFELPFDLVVDSDAILHKLYGTWRMKNMYGKEYMGCLRSTFAISKDGSISWVKYGVRVKGHVEKLIMDLGVA
ncbi:MAG: peroxiredoxin [Marine Group II euryarchaeote MED-G38]|nr:peroxiredoxin [Euryarchaeota archaeon]OUV25592.1 MAG: hypothetical protein CBC57_04615 [Euryarchaeota archaeon TMED97]PDH23818.1 MAG: peroxiredoxin [Marine Group II euryarchaeote MED-G38]|tara:strand:- start:34432 stop:34914 length:483 start_codon:yes stop_codon:yes gene_type:complete